MNKVSIHKEYNDAHFIRINGDWFVSFNGYAGDICKTTVYQGSAKRIMTAKEAIKIADKLNNLLRINKLRNLPNGEVMQ